LGVAAAGLRSGGVVAEDVWRAVIGYEGLYEVCDLGRVRSLDRTVPKRNGGSQRHHGKVLKPRIDRDGYFRVTLCRHGRHKQYGIHQLVLATFRGPCPTGHEGCHNDGDPGHNWLHNLRYDTKRNNNLDTVRHGTHQKSQRTACPRRHPLAPPNLHPGDLRRGRRKCLACDRAHTHLRDLRAKGLDGDLQEVSDRYYAAIVALAEVSR
jgi:hypothetical protein